MKILLAAREMCLVALMVAGCNSGGTKQSGTPAPVPTPQPAPEPAPPDPTPTPDPQPTLPLTLDATQDSIQKLIVDTRCVACHSAATASNRHVVLTDLTKVITPPGAQPAHDHDSDLPNTNLIRPGCPNKSFFYSIMKEGKMPKDASQRLTDDELTKVATWIKSLWAGTGDPCKDTDEPGDDDDDGGEPGTSSGSGSTDEPGT